MNAIAVLVDHDRGVPSPGALEALTAARSLAADLGTGVEAVVLGDAALFDAHGAGLATVCADYGAATVHRCRHGLLSDYGPDAWGASLAAFVASAAPLAVMAAGTDRGAEVMAHLAARTDLPLVANCVAVSPSGAASGDGSAVGEAAEPWHITRIQWGGSLLEDVTLSSPLPLLTIAPHAIEAVPVSDAASGAANHSATSSDQDPSAAVDHSDAAARQDAGVAGSAKAPELSDFEPELSPEAARTLVRDRVTLTEGITLSTAPVVVSGGRGVGSADGFAQLEELADLLGGRVGCSRAVTNNGWRNHADQVGQTGTRIAPEIYIACGISGAIQHWVGAMGSKNILAVNIDPEANMVTKAGYAVIADLHEVVPAISDEIKRRRDRPS